MSDAIQNAIEANATGPKSAEADGIRATQHNLSDQIEADRYLMAKAAAAKRRRGIAFMRIVPPGAS